VHGSKQSGVTLDHSDQRLPDLLVFIAPTVCNPLPIWHRRREYDRDRLQLATEIQVVEFYPLAHDCQPNSPHPCSPNFSMSLLLNTNKRQCAFGAISRLAWQQESARHGQGVSVMGEELHQRQAASIGAVSYCMLAGHAVKT
jgi:hypothetical protein